jgi:hypothetical protein
MATDVGIPRSRQTAQIAQAVSLYSVAALVEHTLRLNWNELYAHAPTSPHYEGIGRLR